MSLKIVGLTANALIRANSEAVLESADSFYLPGKDSAPTNPNINDVVVYYDTALKKLFVKDGNGARYEIALIPYDGGAT